MARSDTFSTFVTGSAASPFLHEGDPVIVRRCDRVQQHDFYLVAFGPDEFEIVLDVEPRPEGVLRVSGCTSATTKHLSHEIGHIYRDADGRDVTFHVIGRVVSPSVQPQEVLSAIRARL